MDNAEMVYKRNCKEKLLNLNAYLFVNDCENSFIFTKESGLIILSDTVGFINSFETWENVWNYLIAFEVGVRCRF